MIESVLSNFDVSSSEEEINKAAHQLALLHWYSICSVPPGRGAAQPAGPQAGPCRLVDRLSNFAINCVGSCPHQITPQGIWLI